MITTKKKGQITIFLILGILVITLVGLSVMLFSDRQKALVVQSTTTENVVLKNYLSSVYEQAVYQGLLVWSSSGGKDTTQPIPKQDYETRSIAYLSDSGETLFTVESSYEELNSIIVRYFYALIDEEYVEENGGIITVQRPSHNRIEVSDEVVRFIITPHLIWEDQGKVYNFDELSSSRSISLSRLLEEVQRFIGEASITGFTVADFSPDPSVPITFCSYDDPNSEATLIRSKLDEQFLPYSSFTFDFLIDDYDGGDTCTS